MNETQFQPLVHRLETICRLLQEQNTSLKEMHEEQSRQLNEILDELEQIEFNTRNSYVVKSGIEAKAKE